MAGCGALGGFESCKKFWIEDTLCQERNEDRDAISEDTDYVDVLASDFVDAAEKLGIGH